MEGRLPELHVKMFGKEKITYDDKTIILGKNSMTKSMKLLLILLHSGKNGITRQRLIEDLFGSEEFTDASNNLRVILFRLKKVLISSGLPKHEYIVSKGGRFYWDSPMETKVDALIFKNLLEQAAEEKDKKVSMDILKEACEMYTGEFLQKLSGDAWVILESVHYKNMYTEALEKLCSYLIEHREYEQVLQMTQKACEMYPLDEWQSYRMDCFIAMNHYKEALKEYENTVQLMMDELGMIPSERMMNQFEFMNKHISKRPHIINEIKKSLLEEDEQKGAFFCTFPGFRDTYRIIRRGMERTGQSVFLMVCTLVDAKGQPMDHTDKLDQMAEELHHCIQNSCRRCDTFTKYSHSQYLVLLMGTNKENCQIVIDRILKNYAKQHKSWADHLVCSVSSIYEVEQEEERFSFVSVNK